MNIKVDRAFNCYVADGKLFCSCSDGIIRVFNSADLKHLQTMSKPPPLGSTNIQAGVSKIKTVINKQSRFADVVVCVVD